MSVSTISETRVDVRGVRVRRGVRVWLLPVVLALALLAAACGGEGSAALVATPAQEAEQGPDVPEGDGEDEAASTTTVAGAGSGVPGGDDAVSATTVVGAAVTTTSVVVVNEGERVVTTVPDIELVDTGAFEHGPQAYVDFVSSYNGRETEAHQHSSADGVIEHLHSYVIGPESHWHEDGKITYQSNASVFTDDDLTEGDRTGLKGQFFCYPGGCQALGADQEPLGPQLGGNTAEIKDLDGQLLYTCAASPVFETEAEYRAFKYKRIQDPESYGCVPVE